MKKWPLYNWNSSDMKEAREKDPLYKKIQGGYYVMEII